MTVTSMRTLACTLIAVASVSVSAHASKPLPGYQCLALNMTPAQAANPNFMLTVRRGPSDQAPVLGTEGALLIAPNPAVLQNGYTQIVRIDGSVGWVPASSTKPWRSPNPAASNARCFPEILDNGRVGFTTR